MSLRYLPEHAESARLALELARRQATRLTRTRRTLFGEVIDLDWVRALDQREDLAEKVDAFVWRFGRLQDHIGQKLIPRFAALLGETPKSLLDVLAYAERLGWLDSAEAFIDSSKLRNLLTLEYMVDPELFLEALHASDGAAQMLVGVVDAIARQAANLGLPDPVPIRL